MKKLLPIILAILGLGAGIGAGLALKPTQVETAEEAPCGEVEMIPSSTQEEQQSEASGEEETNSDFLKMNNQFVVPVVADNKVTALVVMSLSLEMEPGTSEAFYQREPKLRDAFLQVLFDHANSGGFDGVFTEGRKLENLRSALLETAQKTMGTSVRKVLVTDILRQDV